MVLLEDVLALPVFDSTWLATPCEGYLKRPVIGAGTLDYEPFTGDYSIFKPGEVVQTSLGFARELPELAEETLLRMIDTGIAALLIKPVVIDAISERVAAYSQQKGVPLIFYHGRYAEHVIAGIVNLVAEDAGRNELDRMIDEVLFPASTRDMARWLTSIGVVPCRRMRCIAVKPHNGDDVSLLALKGQIESALAAGRDGRSVSADPDATAAASAESPRGREADGILIQNGPFHPSWDVFGDDGITTVTVLRYHQCLLVVIGCNHGSDRICHRIDERMIAELRAIPHIYLGMGEAVACEAAEVTFHQSLLALRSTSSEEPVIGFGQMGVDAFRSCASIDRDFRRTADGFKERLYRHDQAEGTSLLETARVYAAAHGSIGKAAEMLFQHPNTIRNRLRKVKEVMGLQGADDGDVLELLTLVFLVPEL